MKALVVSPCHDTLSIKVLLVSVLGWMFLNLLTVRMGSPLISASKPGCLPIAKC